MKILFVHNEYAIPSGEEQASNALADILLENGHEVVWYIRKSSEIKNIMPDQIKAFFTGIYNPFSAREIKKIVEKENPDIVQVQNIYPFISPSIFKPIKQKGIPVIMRCPNYRLFCPTGLFFDLKGKICEKCTGSGKEFWCILKNCTGEFFKSTAYALRNFFSRESNVFNKYVDFFIVQSEFQRNKFIKFGIPASKLSVLPGIVPKIEDLPGSPKRSIVSFIGRISIEKGIDDFISAAKKLPEFRFAVAGKVPDEIKLSEVPLNIEWRGFLSDIEIDELISQSAVVIVPSKWYEGFPNVITRAMQHSVPVISTNIGCLPEIIEHGNNGFTYSPGDIDTLVANIGKVFSNPEEAEIMGRNGRVKANNYYSSKSIFIKLSDIYSNAKETRRSNV